MSGKGLHVPGLGYQVSDATAGSEDAFPCICFYHVKRFQIIDISLDLWHHTQASLDLSMNCPVNPESLRRCYRTIQFHRPKITMELWSYL